MSVSLKEFNEWKEQGKAMGATHMISVCDTFDYGDYPVFVTGEKELQEKEKYYRSASMQRINEIVPL